VSRTFENPGLSYVRKNVRDNDGKEQTTSKEKE
jgi:hypothetical protein